MAENIFFTIILSIADFFKGTAIFSLPVFFFVIVGHFLRKIISQKFKLKWFFSTSLVSFFLVLAIVGVVYFYPFLLSYSPLPYQTPPELEVPFTEQAYVFFLVLVRLVIVSFLLTVIVFPCILVGSFVFETVSQRTKWPFLLRVFASVFTVTSIVSYFVLFIAPFIVSGILFLIFFGLSG